MRNIIVAFICLFALAFSACRRDAIDLENKQVEITLRLDVPQTRSAVSDAQEKKIDNLRIFVFDKNNNFAYSVNKGEITNEDIRIKLNLSKNDADTYKLVFIGNMKSSDVPDLKGKTIADLQNQAFEIVGKYAVAPFRFIPMWGETQQLKIEKNTDLGTITMLRAIASVDVTLNATNTSLDPATAGSLSNFKLKSIRVYNTREKGLYIPNSSNISSSNIATKPSLLTTEEINSSPLIYELAAGGVNSSTRDIYIAESLNKSKEHLDKTCLVIGGYYGSSLTETYYRVDFKDFNGHSGEMDVLRNHRYLFNITKVHSKGFATPDEAFKSEIMNMDVNILDWANGNITPIKYEGEYILSVDKDIFEIFKEANNEDNKNNRQFRVKTTYSEGWKAVVTEGGTWLNIDKTSGVVNTEASIQISATENSSGLNREGIITITAGSLKWNVKIVQTSQAEIKLEVLEVVSGNDNAVEVLNLPAVSANKKLKIKWLPKNAEVKISRIGADFTGAPNADIASGGSTGVQEYDITPANLTSSGPTDPFPKKLANISFEISVDGRKITKRLVLKQELFNAFAFDDEEKPLIDEAATPLTDLEFSESKFYFMDGGSDNIFKIKSNAPYKVELTNVNTSERNTSTVVDAFTPIQKLGNKQMQEIKFTSIDDRSDKTRIIGYADFKISSTDPNKPFNEKTFRVKTVTVKDVTAESNSHIVRPNGVGILIPVTRALKAPGYNTRSPQLSANPNTRAQLVWTDNSKGMHKASNMRVLRQIGKGENAKMLVVPGSHIGNALIAMKEVDGGTGSAYWSWHIWNTDYTPDTSKEVMDRNLGALATGTAGGTYSFGLLYQWGRRSPFMSEYVIREPEDRSTKDDEVYYGKNADNSNAVVKGKLAGKVSDELLTVEQAVKQPGVFVKNRNDWMTGISDADKKALWGHGGDKSISDPCPYGWRVPDPEIYIHNGSSDYPYNSEVYIEGVKQGVRFKTHGFYPFVDHILDRDATYEAGRVLHSIAWSRSFLYWTNAYGESKTKVLDIENNDGLTGNEVHIYEYFGSGMGFPVRCVKYDKEANSATIGESEGGGY